MNHGDLRSPLHLLILLLHDLVRLVSIRAVYVEVITTISVFHAGGITPALVHGLVAAKPLAGAEIRSTPRLIVGAAISLLLAGRVAPTLTRFEATLANAGTTTTEVVVVLAHFLPILAAVLGLSAILVAPTTRHSPLSADAHAAVGTTLRQQTLLFVVFAAIFVFFALRITPARSSLLPTDAGLRAPVTLIHTFWFALVVIVVAAVPIVLAFVVAPARVAGGNPVAR